MVEEPSQEAEKRKPVEVRHCPATVGPGITGRVRSTSPIHFRPSRRGRRIAHANGFAASSLEVAFLIPVMGMKRLIVFLVADKILWVR